MGKCECVSGGRGHRCTCLAEDNNLLQERRGVPNKLRKR